MFTGIIEMTGIIINKQQSAKNLEIVIEPEKKMFLEDIKKGASISVNGVCLTVNSLTDKTFNAFVSAETWQVTNLKTLLPQSRVNLEKALKLSGRLDGHIVQGHVDCTAVVTGIYKVQKDYELKLRIKPEFLKYIISKGSIAVNGISLTIAEIKSDIISIAVIPETYENTNIPLLRTGDPANIEIDLFAKYTERILQNR